MPFSRTARHKLASRGRAVLALAFRDTFYQLTEEKLVYDAFTSVGRAGAVAVYTWEGRRLASYWKRVRVWETGTIALVRTRDLCIPATYSQNAD